MMKASAGSRFFATTRFPEFKAAWTSVRSPGSNRWIFPLFNPFHDIRVGIHPDDLDAMRGESAGGWQADVAEAQHANGFISQVESPY